jgi:kynurenine formamidase
MCAPKVLETLKQRLSRRDLFKLAAGTAVVTAAAPHLGLARARGNSRTLNLANLTDLSHPLSPDFPMWPGSDPMRIDTLVTVENDGFYANRWDVHEHTGTHMDAPAHFIVGAATADALSLEQHFAPIAVIDIAEKATADPDAMVTIGDIEAWESEHGMLPEGAMVMMYSGWEARAHDPDAFLNMDDAGVMHFPGFSPEAAEFLLRERAVTGVGVDTLSLDHGASQSFDVHLSVLGAGKYGLENVANLKAIPPVGAHLIVGSLKVLGASGGPVRLMATWS